MNCVIVVITHKKKLCDLEVFSIDHMKKVLRHPKCLVMPRSFSLEQMNEYNNGVFENFEIKQFDNKFFESHTNNQLLRKSELFYRSFEDYDYMLSYDTDAIVLKNELDMWCEKDFDYIGAPWFPGQSLGGVRSGGVGNSGLCLRKISSFLKIFDEINQTNSSLRNKIQSNLFEDVFWGIAVKREYPWFNVAPIKEALKFSFEVDPEKCYERNGRKAPFGGHRWFCRENRNFWKSLLEKTQKYEQPDCLK